MQEIDQVMHAAASWNQRCVLATVVRTDGSSYRKPGAVMLVGEDGTTIGAVSGGCIEKEIVRRSNTVFSSGEPELIQYDGRYTLGCNGTIYILIEPFSPADDQELFQQYRNTFNDRKSWRLVSLFNDSYYGSVVVFGSGRMFALRDSEVTDNVKSAARSLAVRKQENNALADNTLICDIEPSTQLFVIGSEIDAVKLARIASEVGFITTLVIHPLNNGVVVDSPDVSVLVVAPDQLAEMINADEQTAVVLTTHSYSRDLGYLESAFQLPPLLYFGIVGPRQRADELLSDLIEKGVEPPNWFDQVFRAPVGLDLGGQFPAEVAISILAELQITLTGHSGRNLSDKQAGIHTVT